MSRTPRPELLSAYLDGELSPQERLRVEDWLARDPAAQKLLEHLKKQQAILRSLPRAACPKDLSQNVLEIAEQRILLEGVTPSRAVAVSKTAETVRPFNTLRTLAKRVFQPRNLGWAILTASIGLAIALLYPRGSHREEVSFRGPQEALRKEALDAIPPTSRAKPEIAAAPTAKVSPENGVEKLGSRASRGAAVPEDVREAPRVESGAARLENQEQLAWAADEQFTEERHLGAPGPSPGVPVVIEGIRTMAPVRQTVDVERKGAKLAGELPLVEIRCDVTPEAPLQALVERLVARRQAVPDDARSEDPWEFAGHVGRRQSGAQAFSASPERGGLPPGTRLELTREGVRQMAIVEFSATEPQLKAVLAELDANRSWLQNVTLPEALSPLVPERFSYSGAGPSAESAGKAGPVREGLAERSSESQQKERLFAHGKSAAPEAEASGKAPSPGRPPAPSASTVQGGPERPRVAMPGPTPSQSDEMRRYRVRLVLVQGSEGGGGTKNDEQAEGAGEGESERANSSQPADSPQAEKD